MLQLRTIESSTALTAAMMLALAVAASCGSRPSPPAVRPAPASASASFVEPSDWTHRWAACGPEGSARVEFARSIVVRPSRSEDRDVIIDPEAVSFEVSPEGCWSSTGSETYVAQCAATLEADHRIIVKARFCIGDRIGVISGTPDCSGAKAAVCSPGPLEPGEYTVVLDTASFKFTTPSRYPHYPNQLPGATIPHGP